MLTQIGAHIRGDRFSIQDDLSMTQLRLIDTVTQGDPEINSG